MNKQEKKGQGHSLVDQAIREYLRWMIDQGYSRQTKGTGPGLEILVFQSRSDKPEGIRGGVRFPHLLPTIQKPINRHLLQEQASCQDSAALHLGNWKNRGLPNYLCQIRTISISCN